VHLQLFGNSRILKLQNRGARIPEFQSIMPMNSTVLAVDTQHVE